MGIGIGILDSAQHGLNCEDTVCRFATDEMKRAREVLLCLTSAEGQVGVFDKAGLFRLREIIDTTRTLRKLVRDHKIAVRIETLASLAAGRPVRDVLEPCAAQVFLDRAGHVRVRVSKVLREQGLASGPLVKELEGLCQKREYKSALTTVLARIKAATQRNKKE